MRASLASHHGFKAVRKTHLQLKTLSDNLRWMVKEQGWLTAQSCSDILVMAHSLGSHHSLYFLPERVWCTLPHPQIFGNTSSSCLGPMFLLTATSIRDSVSETSPGPFPWSPAPTSWFNIPKQGHTSPSAFPASQAPSSHIPFFNCLYLATLWGLFLASCISGSSRLILPELHCLLCKLIHRLV